MSDSGETRAQHVRRNVLASAVALAVVAGGVFGGTAAVNASNAAHAQEVAQIQAAKDGSVVVRADGARDAVLAGSAVQAGVIAQQEAAAKAAAAAAAQAAAAAAAQKAAQEAAAQQAAQTQTVQASSSAQQPSAPVSYNRTQQWTGAKHPSGTAVPTVTDNDPNSGTYGKQIPEYDQTYCASGALNGWPPVCA